MTTIKICHNYKMYIQHTSYLIRTKNNVEVDKILSSNFIFTKTQGIFNARWATNGHTISKQNKNN